MSKQQFITEHIRQSVGQCEQVTDRLMAHMGIERMGHCQACGHKITSHYGVALPVISDNEDDQLAKRYIWVGSECVKTLCKPDAIKHDIDPGTQYELDGRQYILPTNEWRQQLFNAARYPTLPGRASYNVKNSFLDNLRQSLDQYGQLTIKQYEAANKIMNK